MNEPTAAGNRQQELAEQRTLLAEQRTYSAWLRTGLASAATGLAIAKLMRDDGPALLIDSLAVLFVLAGGAMYGLAFWAYKNAVAQFAPLPAGSIRLWMLGLLSAVLFLTTLVGLVLVLAL